MFTVILGLLMFACVWAMFFGLVKPSLFRTDSRWKVFKIFGISFVALSCLAAIASILEKSDEPKETIIATVTSTTNVGAENTSASSSQNQAASQTAVRNALDIGEVGYLRLPGKTDKADTVLLAPTSDMWSEVNRALQSGDKKSVVDLAYKGVFPLTVGAKVKVIDRVLGLRRVRILDAVDPEQRKLFVGEAGWVPMEWVVEK